MVSEETGTIDHKNGPRLVTNSWIDWHLTFIRHVNTNSIASCVIRQNNAGWDCFKTLTSQEILRTQHPLLEEHCAFRRVACSWCALSVDVLVMSLLDFRSICTILLFRIVVLIFYVVILYMFIALFSHGHFSHVFHWILTALQVWSFQEWPFQFYGLLWWRRNDLKKVQEQGKESPQGKSDRCDLIWLLLFFFFFFCLFFGRKCWKRASKNNKITVSTLFNGHISTRKGSQNSAPSAKPRFAICFAIKVAPRHFVSREFRVCALSAGACLLWCHTCMLIRTSAGHAMLSPRRIDRVVSTASCIPSNKGHLSAIISILLPSRWFLIPRFFDQNVGLDTTSVFTANAGRCVFNCETSTRGGLERQRDLTAEVEAGGDATGEPANSGVEPCLTAGGDAN